MPYFFQSTHGCICRSESSSDVFIIAQVVRYEGAQVSKFPREGNCAICNGEILCLFEPVIHGVLAFSTSWVGVLVVVCRVDYPSSVSIVCGKRLGKNADDFSGALIGSEEDKFLGQFANYSYFVCV